MEHYAYELKTTIVANKVAKSQELHGTISLLNINKAINKVKQS